MSEYTAYLIPNYVKTNNYTVDHDGNIEYIYEEINPPIIGKKYHEDNIVWELTSLDPDAIPELYECVFEQAEGDYYRLVDFRTMSL